MPARSQRAGASHANFMRAVNDELTKFERSERELRKKDRDERAKRLLSNAIRNCPLCVMKNCPHARVHDVG